MMGDGAVSARKTTLNFVSYNVRGLNSPIKRFNIIRELTHLKPEVVLLHETHFLHDSNLKINSKDYPVWYYGDSSINWAKGVAIGFVREVRFTLEERKEDLKGRYSRGEE